MDERAVNEAKGGESGETPAPAPEMQPQASSSDDKAIAAIGRDVRLRQRVIRQYEKAERAALRDIARRGAAVIEPRADSHGATHERLVPNPQIRVARECRAAIKALQKEIAGLEARLAVATAPPKELSALESLAARAKELRK